MGRGRFIGRMNSALVVGAGIAGSVVGLGLRRAGVAVTVLEAHPRAKTVEAGSWLTVAVNGLAALRPLGLLEPVLAEAFPSRDLELVNGRGKVLGVAALGGVWPDGTSTQTLKRASLHRVLLEAAEREGVHVHFGARVQSATLLEDGRVRVQTESGDLTADVLLGADGVHSKVRSWIDAKNPAPTQTRLGNVGGFVPAGAVPDASLQPGTYRMMFGRRAFFGWAVHPSGEAWWFANPPTPYPASPDAEWLAALFADDAGPAAALIRATPGPLTFSRGYELPTVRRWHRGAMGILGDAAHAASPSSGQGASLALEDAVELTRHLRERSPADALEVFTRSRRARVERVVAEARRTSSQKVPGAFGAWARDLTLPFFLRMATRANRDWLFEHRVVA